MIKFNAKQLIEERLVKKPNDLWAGSLHEGWNSLPTPQAKGDIGTEIYQQYLQKLGFEIEIVSDEGDIRYRKDATSPWIKDEVKVSKATLNVTHNGNKLSEKLWFNQIRPSQTGWGGIVLVGIYPESIRIWRKDRQTWDETYRSLHSVQNGLKHTGQAGDEQLEQVTLVKNSRTNNFGEWDELSE
jgi:hypothetical protein|tara:strand:- start:242 stop:796 length:555 start_codon:yes stop_codon:yes gene_type:complete